MFYVLVLSLSLNGVIEKSMSIEASGHPSFAGADTVMRWSLTSP